MRCHPNSKALWGGQSFVSKLAIRLAVINYRVDIGPEENMHAKCRATQKVASNEISKRSEEVDKTAEEAALGIICEIELWKAPARWLCDKRAETWVAWVRGVGGWERRRNEKDKRN